MKRAMKWFLSLLASTAILCGGFLVVHGSLPPVSINAWLPAGNLTAPRAGAASVLLQDGRVLITGGNGASGVLATTDILDTSSGFIPGPAMNFARSNHVAVLLQDGRVLVAGGTDASGLASQSAELFDPAKNTWSAAGPLMVGRSGATATLLADGRVLIAGGTANGAALQSLELFDPNANTFSLVAGTLSSARENHAAALLPDGRVLIAGGWDGTSQAPVPPATTGGPNVLASTDIFDPSTGTAAPGPALASPRMNFTATTALDGSVVAIGGTDGQNDLASIGVLAPGAGAFVLSGAQLATARQGHQAFLLPHNGNILVVGGTSSGVSVSSAELYTPWLGATSVTGAMASARSRATGSPLFQTILGAPVGIDGALLVAGGLDAASPPNTLASAEVYGFATIKTDQSDYPPGTPVTITGSGWQPGETVQMSLVENPDLDGDSPIPLTAIADANGNITNTSFSTNIEDANIHFTLTATGAVSQAQTTFTDSVGLSKVSSIGAQTPNPVVKGNSATYAVTVTFTGGGGGSCTSTLSASGLPTGASASFTNNPFTGSGSGTPQNSTLTVSTNSSTTPIGTTTFTIKATGSGGCSGSASSGTSGNAPNPTIAVVGPASKVQVETAANGSGSVLGPANVASGTSVTGYAIERDASNNFVANVAAGWSLVSKTGGVVDGDLVPSGDTKSAVFTGHALGTAQVQAMADTFTGTSGTLTVVVGAAAQLVFGQQPTNTVAGATITPAITVKEEDASGNVVTSDNSTSIAIAILNNPASGTLSGTTSQKVSNGIATFSDLSINNAGNAYTLQAAHGGLTSATSSPFNITSANVATTLTLDAPSPASVSLGSAGPVTFTAHLTRTSGGAGVQGATIHFTVDGTDVGTTATTDATGTATLSTYNPSALAAGSHNVQASFTAATISGTSYTASNSGTQTLKVTSPITVNTSVAGLKFTVDGTDYTTPQTFQWDPGSNHTISTTSPQSGSPGTQYIFQNWSAGPTPNNLSQSITAPSTATTYTANFKTQYQVTFNISGVSTDVASGTQVVSLTSPSAQSVTFSQLTSNSYSQWFDAGSTVSGTFANPLASTTTGKQYALSSGSPFSFSNLSAPQTAAGAYGTQWQVTFTAQDQSNAALTGTSGTVVTVNTVNQTANPYQAYFDANSTPSFSFPAVIASTTSGKQFAYVSQSMTSPLAALTGPVSVMATYKVQYQVTFTAQDQSNTALTGTSGKVVTVNNVDQATNPYQAYFDANSTPSFSFPTTIASTTSGKRYAFVSQSTTSPLAALTGPVSVTATYKTQYQVTFTAQDQSNAALTGTSGTVVTVNSVDQTTNPYQDYFDANSTPSFSFPAVIASTTSGKQFAYVSQSMTSPLAALTGPVSVTATYKVQYQVTFTQSGIGSDTGTNQVLSLIVNGGSPTSYSASTLPPATWYDASTVLTYTYSATVATSPASGKRYALTNTSPTSPYTVNAPQTITGTYKTQWQITFGQSGLSSDVTGTVVTVGAGAKAYGDLPFSDWFDDGSSLTYAYSNPVASTITGKQYALTTPAPSPASGFTVGSSITITGTFKVQWLITFAATGLGGDVTPGSTIVTVNLSAQAAMPYSVYLDAESKPSYAYSSPVSTTVTGKRYILTTPAPTPSTGFTVTGTLTITATYKAQYDTSTAAASSVNPSILAQPVNFTATVTTIASGGGTPTGSVQFKVDGSNFGSPVALSGGTANSATTTTLTVGTHTVEADYTPDTDTYTSSIGTLAGDQKVQYMTGGVCDGDLGHSILQPINPDGSSVFKQKSTVPAKFRVCDYNGNSVGPTSAFPNVVSAFNIIQIVSGTVTSTVNEPVDSTTPDSMFRWDSTAQQWIFNTNTKGLSANTTYTFRINLVDGSAITYMFGLK